MGSVSMSCLTFDFLMAFMMLWLHSTVFANPAVGLQDKDKSTAASAANLLLDPSFCVSAVRALSCEVTFLGLYLLRPNSPSA